MEQKSYFQYETHPKKQKSQFLRLILLHKINVITNRLIFDGPFEMFWTQLLFVLAICCGAANANILENAVNSALTSIKCSSDSVFEEKWCEFKVYMGSTTGVLVTMSIIFVLLVISIFLCCRIRK